MVVYDTTTFIAGVAYVNVWSGSLPGGPAGKTGYRVEGFPVTATLPELTPGRPLPSDTTDRIHMGLPPPAGVLTNSTLVDRLFLTTTDEGQRSPGAPTKREPRNPFEDNGEAFESVEVTGAARR